MTGSRPADPFAASHQTFDDALRPSPSTADVLLAGVVLAASVVNVASQDAVGIGEIPIVGFLLLASGSIALAWRRSRPVVVVGVALAMTGVWMALGHPGNPVFHILASLYAVGRYVADWRVNAATLAAALTVVVSGLVADGDPISDIVTALVVTTLPWYVGRRLRARAIATRERAEYLEWQRANEAERVIADARAGIARELHDVVAHNVSVMTIQAGVARLVTGEDPDRARAAMGAVEEAGRRTLDELRHLLGVLRPGASTDELGPQPALSQLHALVDRLRQMGMRISLVGQVPSGLPVRVELFAYRIVQEALTNVLKHAGVDATAQVRLEEAEGHLQIEVTDTGSGPSALPGSGQGIAGMRERALLLGGTFEAGPRLDGGFRVHARLPIGEQ